MQRQEAHRVRGDDDVDGDGGDRDDDDDDHNGEGAWMTVSAISMSPKVEKWSIIHLQDLPVGNINFVRQQNPGVNIP